MEDLTVDKYNEVIKSCESKTEYVSTNVNSSTYFISTCLFNGQDFISSQLFLSFNALTKGILWMTCRTERNKILTTVRQY